MLRVSLVILAWGFAIAATHVASTAMGVAACMLSLMTVVRLIYITQRDGGGAHLLCLLGLIVLAAYPALFTDASMLGPVGHFLDIPVIRIGICVLLSILLLAMLILSAVQVIGNAKMQSEGIGLSEVRSSTESTKE